MSKGIVLITGATAGFGEACACRFAQEGFDLILLGRRKERLDKLSAELQKKHGIKTITLEADVRHYETLKSKLEGLSDNWKEVDILINNAGLASGLAPIHEGDINDWEVMIDTNVKGLLYVTRIVSPWMVARKKGHIFNIGSIAGKEAYANGNVYCATKHAVDSLSKSMRIDLVPFNIKVTNIAPGMAETEFSLVRFKGNEERAKTVYQGMEPLTGKDIAETVYFAATLPAHVTLNDIVIMPTAQANATTVVRK